MIRIEVFKNIDASAKGREFVALIEAIEQREDGKRRVGSCVNIFRSSADGARQAAIDFIAAERAKQASIKMTKRRRVA